MKTRQGFVSNSSSSSFIVYGVLCDSKEEMFAKLMANSPQEAFDRVVDCGGMADDLKDELELEDFTLESLNDEAVRDWIVDNGRDWDLFCDLSVSGFEVYSSEEDDEGVAGVYVGSCDYGVSSLGDIERIIKDHKDDLTKAFGQKPGLYSVYTGY